MACLTRRVRGVSLGALLVVSSPVLAIPLTYEESSDGDLSGDVLNFAAGSNTVSGSTSASSTSTGGSGDLDDFDFVIPSDLTLDAVFIELSNIEFTNISNFADAELEIELTGPGVSDFAGIDLFDAAPATGPTSVFEFSLPGQDGTYAYLPLLFISPLQPPGGDFGGDDIAVSFDYTWTFDVGTSQTVPAPSSIALLFLGFAVMFSRLAKGRK